VKIVVTGALGHIGSFVIRELPKKFPNSDIVLIDSMLTQRYASLFNLPTTANYSFVEADIRSVDLKPLFAGAHVVVHLAAITDAAGSFDKAALVEANNFESTERVARACLEVGTRLIALSSTSVYGTQKEVVAEDCSEDELKPQSPYAETKLKEERLVTSLAAEKGLKAISCRFGTIFGASPGMRFHTAVNKFCWQAIMRTPLTVWKTAYQQKRPYLDLLDASRAISHVIDQDIFDGRIYNILTINATVQQITDSIKKFVPHLEINFVDNQIMNQLSYEVSTERFKATGFNYEGDLDQKINETLTWLKQANSAMR
jgi:UDP-glucose 4-epimerase